MSQFNLATVSAAEVKTPSSGRAIFIDVADGIIKAKNSDGTVVAITAGGGGDVEGTAVLSTGEVGGTKFLREDGDGTSSWQPITGGGDALVANPLSQFAATTSAQLAEVISDETGSGLLVFGTSPTLVTPTLGTPASGVLTNCTGLPNAAVTGLGGAALLNVGTTAGTVAAGDHTQAASTISDFQTAVSANTDVTANTTKETNATHTGDVTGAGALTIANDAVTNAKLANVATATIKGRNTAGTGDPEDLTRAQVLGILGLPYDVVLGFDGVLENDDEDRLRLARDVTYKDASTVYALIDDNPTATTTLTISIGATTLGTLSIVAAGTITWTEDAGITTDTNFNAGDIVKIVGPATADATLAGVRATIPLILR